MWYEFYRDIENDVEKGDCVQDYYADNDKPFNFKIITSELIGPKGSQTKVNGLDGRGWQGTDASGNLTVNLAPSIPVAPYRVIETDYTSYALVHTCKVYFGLVKVELNWAMTRQPLEVGTKAWTDM